MKYLGPQLTGIILPDTAPVVDPQAQKIAGLALTSAGGNVRLAMDGTSLVQQNDVGSATKIAHQARGWMSWARGYAKGLWDVHIWPDTTVRSGFEPSGVTNAIRGFYGANGGVSGQTLDQIAAKEPTLLASVTADVWLDDGGTNDIGNLSKEDIYSKRVAQIERKIAVMGAKPIGVLPILYRSLDQWPLGGTLRLKAEWVNQQLVTYVYSKTTLLLVDWNIPWCDPATSAPYPSYTPDGTHFSTPGGQAVGKWVADWLAKLIKGTAPTFTSDNNLFTNGAMTGTTGNVGTGVTGVAATGSRIERFASTPVGDATAVASKETDGNGAEWQVLTITPGAVDSTFYIRTNAADTTTTLGVGTWVQGEVLVKSPASAGIKAIDLFLQDRATGGLIAYDMEPFTNDSGVAINTPAVADERRLITPAFKLAAPATAGQAILRYRLEVSVAAGATGPIVVKCRNMKFGQAVSPQTLLNYVEPPVPVAAVKAVGRWNPMNDGVVAAAAGLTTYYVPVKMITGSGDATGLQLNFPAWYTPNTNTGMGTDLGNDINILEASLQTATTSAPVTFTGARTGVVPNGGNLISDVVTPEALGFTGGVIPVGTVLFMKMKATIPSGGKMPTSPRNLYGQSNLSGWFYNSANTVVPSVDALANSTSGYTGTKPTDAGNLYAPLLIGTYKDATTKAYAGWGDSIESGYNDLSPGYLGGGFFQRALALFPVPAASINFGISGAKSPSLATDPRILAYMKYVPDGLHAMVGTNDFGISTPPTASAIIANIDTMIAR